MKTWRPLLAYLRCIGPTLECAVCYLFSKVFTEDFKKLQSRAAKFVLGRYRRMDSASAMKVKLYWELLTSRQWELTLKPLYAIFHGKAGINREPYLKLPHYVSICTAHSLEIRGYHTRTGTYANSFFVRLIGKLKELTETQVCCVSEDVLFSLL